MQDISELIARLQARGTDEARMIGGGIVLRKIVQGPVYEGATRIERHYATIDQMPVAIERELR
jgi:hypothetical protein